MLPGHSGGNFINIKGYSSSGEAMGSERSLLEKLGSLSFKGVQVEPERTSAMQQSCRDDTRSKFC